MADEGFEQTQSYSPRTYYAAVKWPVGATREEISRTIGTDLDVLALTLIEEHGYTLDQVRELFENAITTAEWEHA